MGSGSMDDRKALISFLLAFGKGVEAFLREGVFQIFQQGLLPVGNELIQIVIQLAQCFAGRGMLSSKLLGRGDVDGRAHRYRVQRRFVQC